MKIYDSVSSRLSIRLGKLKRYICYTVKNILYLCQKRSLLKFLCWIF